MARTPNIELSLSKINPESPKEKWIKLLSTQILSILRNDHQKIINILYKADVSEEKAKNAFKLVNDEDIAEELANLLVSRELQKIEIRKKYS